jgi:hypothetical protein
MGGFFSELLSAFTEIVFEELPYSLDVDGDGIASALGDGLMIIRYLFGAAFEGEESRTAKALSNTSPFYDEPMAWSLVAEQIESLVPASPTL